MVKSISRVYRWCLCLPERHKPLASLRGDGTFYVWITSSIIEVQWSAISQQRTARFIAGGRAGCT